MTENADQPAAEGAGTATDARAEEALAAERAAALAEKEARKKAKARKKLVKSLRLSGAQAHRLVRVVDVGIAVHDLLRDESGTLVDYRIREVNEAFESLLELDADEVNGSAASATYGQRGRAPFLKQIAGAMASGQACEVEGSVRSRRGRLRFHVQPLDDELFAFLVEDATEDAKSRRRLAYLERRVRQLGEERAEVDATLAAARAEASALEERVAALERELAGTRAKAASKSAALSRESAKLERESQARAQLEATLAATREVHGQLRQSVNAMGKALRQR